VVKAMIGFPSDGNADDPVPAKARVNKIDHRWSDLTNDEAYPLPPRHRYRNLSHTLSRKTVGNSLIRDLFMRK
jgi:hypothetical protein